MSGFNSSEILALELSLKAALDEARERFDRAKVELDKATVLAKELGVTHPDGCHALRSASRQYQSAIGDYRQALTRWCRLVIDRKLPEDQ